MKHITFQDIKTGGAKVIADDQITYLIVNSKPKSVMVPPDQYEAMMEALEELEDIRDYVARKDEKTIPLEEAFPDLAA